MTMFISWHIFATSFETFFLNHKPIKETNLSLSFFTFGSLKVYVPITNSEIFKSEAVQFLLKYFCQSIEYMSYLIYDLLFYY